MVELVIRVPELCGRRHVRAISAAVSKDETGHRVSESLALEIWRGGRAVENEDLLGCGDTPRCPLPFAEHTEANREAGSR